jgi:Cytochrome c554 and c-prime
MRTLVVLSILLSGSAQAAELRALSSAEVCGRCHRAILESWKQSAHARAMESPIFQDALDAAVADFGAGARRTCLNCHSPIAVHTGDLTLQQKVSWEGVTCDYCHSIREVAEAPVPKARLEFSLVKFGPLKDSASGGHATAYSAVHSSARVCAPCHEYRNAKGFAVLTTYSEWKASRYAREGKNCQSCHMWKVAGSVVDPRVQRAQSAKINLHQMPGSHSIEQLTRTVKARMSASREDSELRVSIHVSNQAAGHYVPTGSPARQLILEVVADADGQRFRGERAYRRVITDAAGAAITKEHVAFINGAKVSSDTRLAPDESRTETFAFPIKRAIPARVRVTFWYYYSPMAQLESQKRVTFLTLSQMLP